MKGLIVVLGAVAVGAASLAGASGARETAAFTCPKSQTAKPSTLWVRTVLGGHGSQWCNDGAKATTGLGKLPKLAGGVCTRSSQVVGISIGTQTYGTRRANDPAQVIVLDHKAGTGNEDGAQIGVGKFSWISPVKIKWTSKLTGTFSGVDQQVVEVNGERTVVDMKANGTFNCSRIVVTGL